MLNPLTPTHEHRRSRAVSSWVIAAVLLFATLGASHVWAAEGDDQAERIAVGQAAPSFELNSSDGQLYSLSDLKDKKSLVLIFFRGTW